MRHLLTASALVLLLGAAPASASVLFSDTFAPSCITDTDGDGLVNCYEYSTGFNRGPSNPGTYPENADTDGDGLLDGDEVVGTADGLDLPQLGVSPVKKDILLELDWFNDSMGGFAHSHFPGNSNYDPIPTLKGMFAAAPVANPDRSQGINLIVDHGQGAGGLVGGNLIQGFSAALPGGFDSTYLQIKSQNFASNRSGYFHYGLLAHSYSNGSASSGLGELIGDDFLVTLGPYASELNWVVGTIAHELGHNLGLHHGGFEACNGKPNYNSVMNYKFQFYGVDLDGSGNVSCDGYSDGILDYSLGSRRSLNEASVYEPHGLCSDVTKAVDLNGNGSIQSYAITADLNAPYNATCSGPLTVLTDNNDWAAVNLAGGIGFAPGGLQKSATSVSDCPPRPTL